MAMTQSRISPQTEEGEGYIFMCSKYSLPEIRQCMIYGMPEYHYESVRRLRPGTPLFLYNYSTGCLHGIFEVTSGDRNIDPYAWPIINEFGRSFYPAQLGLRWKRDCPPLTRELSLKLMERLGVTEFSEARFGVKLRPSEAQWISILFKTNADAVISQR